MGFYTASMYQFEQILSCGCYDNENTSHVLSNLYYSDVCLYLFAVNFNALNIAEDILSNDRMT